MHLTGPDIQHLKRALLLLRFWQGLRWLLAAILINVAIAHLAGFNRFAHMDLVAAAGAALALCWRGLCPPQVLHSLHRLASSDPQAHEQLMQAGVPAFAEADSHAGADGVLGEGRERA